MTSWKSDLPLKSTSVILRLMAWPGHISSDISLNQPFMVPSTHLSLVVCSVARLESGCGAGGQAIIRGGGAHETAWRGAPVGKMVAAEMARARRERRGVGTHRRRSCSLAATWRASVLTTDRAFRSVVAQPCGKRSGGGGEKAKKRVRTQ